MTDPLLVGTSDAKPTMQWMLRSVRFATTVRNREEQIVRKFLKIGEVVAW